MSKNNIFFDTEDTYEEGADFSIKRGRLIIAVAQEQAVGSYNDSFECTATLSRKQGIELRDWLCKMYD